MLPFQTYLRAVHHVCAYPTRRGFSAGSTPLTTRITSPFNDEVLTASAQQFFTNRQGDAGSNQHQHQHQHHSQQHSQQGAPLISPPPGTILPRLHEITLWDVVRLFKVKEDMVGVESFPHLRTQSLLGHANKLLTRMQWGEARGGGVGERVDLKRTDQRLAVTPQDDAALHALAVHVGDRYALALGEGGGEWEGGWGTAAAGGALSPSLPPQDDEVARLPNFSKQHLSPAIVAVVGCGAWPPTAIADVAATLGPRKLLSVEAEGALLKYASAVFSAGGGGGGGGGGAAAAGSLASPSSLQPYPHPHLQSLHPLDAVNLILGLTGCSVEGVPPLAMDALFRASAPYFTRMCATSPPTNLSEGGENATTTTTYMGNSGNSSNSSSPPPTPILLPMPALAKLAHSVAARYGGDVEGDVPGGALHRLAEALGEACLGRIEAQQGALMGSGGGGGGGGAPLSTTATTAAGLRGQEAVFAGYAISIARSLGSMGVFQRELLVALGEAWVKRWGSVCQKHISPATAGDALFLASLVATEKKLGGMGGGKSGGGGGGGGGHSLPHFPPLPIRLTAAWVSYDGKYSNNSSSNSNGGGGGGGGNAPLSLILIDGLGTGLRNRPPLYIPQRRPSAMVLAGAFAAAWEGALSQNQHQHQHQQQQQRGGAMVLGGVPLTSTARQILSCGVWRGNGGGACFVTPEGVALDVAVPGAKCGVRVLPQRALRPGKDGLRAGIGAEQGVLEASGWTVEYVLEADINSKEACRERAVGLAASLLVGAVRRKEESSNKGFVL